MKSISTLVIGFLIAVTAEAGSPLLSTPKAGRQDQPDVLVGAKRGGPFKGDDRYEVRPSARQQASLAAGSRGTFGYYKIQNDGAPTNTPSYTLFLVRGSKSDKKFEVSYFGDRGKNITSRVTRGRGVVNLAADDETLIRQKIVPIRKGTRASSKFSLSAKNSRSSLADSARVSVKSR